jgi:hypothetical protein
MSDGAPFVVLRCVVEGGVTKRAGGGPDRLYYMCARRRPVGIPIEGVSGGMVCVCGGGGGSQ